MPSGIRGRANPDYSSTEYAQPWGGIDVSKPSSQIEPSSCVSLTGSIVRGGATNSPTIVSPFSATAVVTPPTFPNVGEHILLTTNLLGVTILITQYAVYADNVVGPGFINKNFVSIFTFPTPYADGSHMGSVIIGKSLYFSSSSALGVYQITGTTVTEITAINGSGPFIGGDFLFTISNRLILWNIIGGDGNQQIGSVTPSTNTNYPDRVAWSFSSAYGFFDPHAPITAGGFDQITEARGLGTGAAVFEAVGMLAHNGGFTEMVPNVAGGNQEPFTFAPLWSADQGVVCRYGSMAQYGAMCRFLGYDQPYQLSPGGLTPFGNKVASLVQNFSLYNDGLTFTGGFSGINGGLFGSIVEIEGEMHYLIQFVKNQPGASSVSTLIFDCLLSTDSWTTWTYPFALTAPIYQSYDTQLITGPITPQNISRDNWILVAYATANTSVTRGILGEVLIGTSLFNYSGSPLPLFTGALIALNRAETPTINIPQTTRKVMVEYENIPALSATPTVVGIELFGQPLQGGYPNVGQTPITNSFSIACPYYTGSNVPANAVLTAFSEPIGTANTTLATSIQITTSQPIRLIRVAIVAETTQADQK